jgi:predicted thioesterase
MSIVLSISPGAIGAVSLVVGEEHTAARVGSGKIGVLATPVLINLFEAAALKACEHLLPPGHQSLGTLLSVSHTAATPAGMQVHAEAEVIAVEGRTLRFKLKARDAFDTIGEGTHERVVVNVAKFDQRVERKRQRVEK